LVFLATAPRPGAVGDGFCPPLRPEEAAAVHAAWLRRIVQPIPGIATFLHGHPPNGLEMLRYFAVPGVELRAQRGADRWARLAASFEDAFAAGYAPVAVRSTEAPDAGIAEIEAAFAQSRPGRIVLAPDQRDGFWLAVLAAPCPELFSGLGDVPLAAARERVAARARELGLEVAAGPVAHAVHTWADLQQLAELRGGAPPPAAGRGAEPMRLRQAIPVLPVRNLQAAKQWYEVQLGCELVVDSPRYAGMRRGAMEIHLSVCDEVASGGLSGCRVEVAGIDALYAELQPRDILHAHGGLRDQPWGFREFTVVDCDGNAITFAERS
jgi:catechol 2,3-dioxygenase-like lactoylglutathione lyase family enzyme